MPISIRAATVPGCVFFNNFVMMPSLKLKQYISILVNVLSIRKFQIWGQNTNFWVLEEKLLFLGACMNSGKILRLSYHTPGINLYRTLIAYSL